MSNIPNAKPSPRIECGVLTWYEGDTFSLDLTLELTDADGAPVSVGEDDSVKVLFKNRKNAAVKEFAFSGADVSGDTLRLTFDAAVSALFPAGGYTYDVYFASSERSTVAKGNRVVVE